MCISGAGFLEAYSRGSGLDSAHIDFASKRPGPIQKAPLSPVNSQGYDRRGLYGGTARGFDEYLLGFSVKLLLGGKGNFGVTRGVSKL